MILVGLARHRENPIVLRTVIAISITLSLAMAAAVRAQAALGSAASGGPVALLNRIKGVTEQLDLSADQKNQVEAIFKKAADDLHSASDDLQNASSDEKSARYRDLFADLRQQVGDVLTDDQKSQLQDKLQALRNPTTSPAGGTDSPNPPSPATPAPGQRSGGLGLNNGAKPGGGFGGGAGGGGMGRGQYGQRLKNALDQLNLSSDQQAQVDDLIKGMREQVRSIFTQVQNGTIDRDAARQKVMPIFLGTLGKINAILTPDQQEKLKQALQQSPAGPQGRAARPGNQNGAGPFGGNQSGQNRAAQTPTENPPVIAAPPTTAPSAAASPAASTAHPLSVGQPAPDFSLKALDSETVSLSSYKHKVLVLVLGSYTNPPFRDHAEGLQALRDKYGTNGVNFLVIYTKETHPTGGWEIQRNKTDNINIAQPKTQAERNAIANRAKAAMNLSILTAPDTMDDKTATAYAVGDGAPAYVIGRDGTILFHQSWLEPMALGQAIEDALK
jgi:Spy/CpxP family protein refolding chaperone